MQSLPIRLTSEFASCSTTTRPTFQNRRKAGSDFTRTGSSSSSTPRHGSRLNLVETMFSKMARSMLRGIRVESKQELIDRIHLDFDPINSDPVVFRWKYKTDGTRLTSFQQNDDLDSLKESHTAGGRRRLTHAFHGSITCMPQTLKSPVLRVASGALWERAIAEIVSSNCEVGRPAEFRSPRCARRPLPRPHRMTEFCLETPRQTFSR